MRKMMFFIIFIGILLGSLTQATAQSFITYELTWGRFGDHLVSYMHAKWLSYKYGLTLLYRPFIYSDRLVLDSEEKRFFSNERFARVFRIPGEDVFQQELVPGALYMMPYFPESPYERNAFGGMSFDVDWHDEGFIKELKKMIYPKIPTKKMVLPKDKMTVALHIRRGGSYDVFDEGNKSYPVKFPKNYFYVDALKEVYTILGAQPLYVYIFTDDQQPEKLAEYFSEIFKDTAITFDYRHTKNDHNVNVLDDFFALMQFDCLIRPDSNFSLCVSKIKKYLIEIAPDDCTVAGNYPLVSSMAVSIDKGRSERYSYKKNCESFCF